MNPNIKVILIQRVFPQYRKSVYRNLTSYFDFTILHSKGYVGIPEASTYFSKRIAQFKYAKGETKTILWPFSELLKHRPNVIIHEFAIGILSLPITLIFAKIIGSKFILWSHGYNRKFGFSPETKINDKYRLWLMKKADALILYGQHDKLLLSKYILNEKIFVAQNTLDTKSLLKIKDRFLIEGKEIIKKRIGFQKKHNLTFIGRLLKDKHPDLLIKIYEILIQKKMEVGIHFIGEGELLISLQREVYLKGYENDIFFHGEIHDDIKAGELLFCSDLMVMPGYLGLSVNHAFCFDCPVISFSQGPNGPYHSPEVEYIINGETGFLVNKQTVTALSETIYFYLINEQIQEKIRLNINNMITNICSIENMEKGIIDAINYSRQ